MEKNSLSVPVAIVVAGLIIAGAVYFSNRQPGTAIPAQNYGSVADGEIKISPVGVGDHIVGSPTASVIFVEYSDTECPFCQAFHRTLIRLTDALGPSGKLAWVYRHFPLWKSENGVPPLHSRAGKEAEATECAAKLGGNEKFWEYTNLLYATTPTNNGLDPAELPKMAVQVGLNEKAFNDCLMSGEMAAKVELNYQEARANAANGTPWSVIIAKKSFDPKALNEKLIKLIIKYRSSPEYFTIGTDNQRIVVSGNQPYELLRDLIDYLQ